MLPGKSLVSENEREQQKQRNNSAADEKQVFACVVSLPQERGNEYS